MSVTDTRSTFQDVELVREPSGFEPGATSPGLASQQRSVSTAGQLNRWFHTLRHYRAGQLVRRAVSMVRERWLPARLDDREIASPELATLNPVFVSVAERLRDALGETLAGSAAEILSGRFCFLNQYLELGMPINWSSRLLSEVSRLWRFHLQYHEWMFGITACDDATAVWRIVGDWIEQYSGPTADDSADAWHPFCISRRVPVWTSMWALTPPPDGLADGVARSLFRQAMDLERRLEKDLGGNHLLENARGLAFAGCFFERADADRWRQEAMRIVRSEVGEQVLPHGEHFERSPMYHCEMLGLFTDLRDLFERAEPDFSATCGEVVEKMGGYLESILHPDGEIPLLGDSCFGESVHPAALLRSCKSVRDRNAAGPTEAKQIGPYWSYRDGSDFLLIDAGPVGPDHLPAHAHADLLTLEASVGGRRLIVDSGVYDYESGPMRQYCRSTAAHNVLEIDGENQCDTWSRFRMGRRGRPSALRTGIERGLSWAAASHNAYRHRGVARTARWVGCESGSPWIIVDWVEGSGTHRFVNRLHLHPDATVELAGENRFLVRLADQSFRVSILGRGTARIGSGWYCPEFGFRYRTNVLECSFEASAPVATGWQVVWGGETPSAQLRCDDSGAPVLVCAGGALMLRDCLG
jgi:uncharacterized heparinase superfamily protein